MEQTPSTQPTEQHPPLQNPQPPPAATSSAVSTSTPSLPPPSTTTSFPNSNPTTTPQSQQQSTTSQTRPPFNTRPWQQPPYSHFSLPPSPLPSSSAPPPSSISAPQPPRGGMAIGVPAHNPSAPSPPPASFSSLTPPSYGQQSQIRQPIQGMGMTGTLGTSSSMRPTGVPSHQLRPSQPSLRPPQTATSSQPPSSQNFQGHGMLRVSTLGSPASPSPSSSQSPQTQTQGQTQTQTQPWLSSGTQGRPPIPSPSPRPQPSSQPFQQRSHVPLQNLPNIPTNQQQPISSGQQSLQSSGSGSGSGQPMELYRPVNGAPRSITHQQQMANQQQITRGAGLASQRPPLGLTQSGGGSQLGAPSKTVNADAEESSSRIISKRSIQELVNQIDPSEKLDPEVEDILVDIAEDFVDSITTFGCNLAKHRKSSTLEAKDILLHLERNWNMTLPGYGGDEIKFYKKPIVSEIHRERLAAVKKSMLAAEMASKNPGGPSGGNAKGHLAKGPALTIGSPPNPKIREAA